MDEREQVSVWNDKEALRKLEAERDIKRLNSGRLTFDCLHLKWKDDRAYCELGKILGQSKDRTVGLVAVLRGITCGVCRNCKDFIGEE